MFTPQNIGGKFFKAYLKTGSHPSKVRIQNLLGQSGIINPVLIRNEQGVVFSLPANDWITRIMLKEGNYEAGSVELATAIMQHGGNMIDIGANFGLYSCAVAVASRLANIIAIEPNFKMIPFLLNNIRLNDAGKSIKIFNTAITSAPGFVTMQQPAADNLGTTQTREGSVGLLNIGSNTLEQLLEYNHIQEVELIKIDIEGNEFAVFNHFDFLKFKVNNIILEFNHLSPVSLPELLEFFSHKGFAAFTTEGNPLPEAQLIPENNIWFKKK